MDRFIVISSVVRGAGTWKIIVRHEKELKTKTVDQYDFVNFYGYYFIAKGVGWIGRYDAGMLRGYRYRKSKLYPSFFLAWAM